MTPKTTPLGRLLALGTVGMVVALAACSGSDGTDVTGDDTGKDSGSQHPGHDGSASTGDDDDGSVSTGDDDDGSTSPGDDDAATGGGTDSGLDARARGDARSDAADTGTSTTSDSGTPTADESAWLDPQNAARTAVGEQPLVWNEAAAKTALAYAQKCTWAHNPNRNAEYLANGGDSKGVGENIAAGAPSQTIAKAVASWVNEKSIYDYATNTCNPTPQMGECGHYTQIVWAKTTSVGCAKVTCTTNWPFGSPVPAHPTWDYSVCDYAPPGNYVGQKPY